MKVRDLIARMPEQFMDLDAAGIIMVAATEVSPVVVSSCHPELAREMLAVVAGDGANWDDWTQHKPHQGNECEYFPRGDRRLNPRYQTFGSRPVTERLHHNPHLGPAPQYPPGHFFVVCLLGNRL